MPEWQIMIFSCTFSPGNDVHPILFLALSNGLTILIHWCLPSPSHPKRKNLYSFSCVLAVC